MTLIDFWPLLIPAAFLLVLIGLLLHQRKVNRLHREAMRALDREMIRMIGRLKP